MEKEVRDEAAIVKYNIRKLKMAYKEALKTDKNWNYVYNSAVAFFKELQSMERSLLGNDKEFLRDLDKMIEIYQKARECVTALKFRTLTLEDE